MLVVFLHCLQHFRGIVNVGDEEQAMAELTMGETWLGLIVVEIVAYETSLKYAYVKGRGCGFKVLAEHCTQRWVIDQQLQNKCHGPLSR